MTDRTPDSATDAQAPAEDADKVWDMLARIDVCMFTTHCADPVTARTGASGAAEPLAGALRARPMSTIPTREDGAIYLLTEAGSTAARDVAAQGDVLLSYQGGGDHVALTGAASVSTDTALVRRLWSPGAEVFWPDGPVAHDVVALIVKPQRADYWDGPNPAVGAVKFLTGLLTGRQPDMGERGVADLSG